MPDETKKVALDASLEKKDHVSASNGGDFDIRKVFNKFDDMDFFKELATIFMKDTSERIEELKHFLNNRDAQKVENLAHELKGASINFGIDRLHELFAQLQELGKERKFDEASGVLSEATDLYEQVSSSLKRILNTSS